MKKLAVMTGVVMLLCGCGDGGNSASRVQSSQNSVFDVLSEGMTDTEENKTDSGKEMVVASGVEATKYKDAEILDLSSMNANMVYSEVFAMMTEPEKYVGKTVKMTGVCGMYLDRNTGEEYYSCIIKDATACCAQGIEFRLSKGAYPAVDSEITVVGNFNTYEEEGNNYISLFDAELIS